MVNPSIAVLCYLLCLLHLSNCNIFNCNKPCNETNEVSHDFCCSKIIKTLDVRLPEGGLPLPAPHDLTVDWFVPESVSEDCANITLNITWHDTVQTAVGNESKGYLIEILRSNSAVSHKVWIKLNKLRISQSSKHNKTISLNYKQDYQIGSTLLIPERMYFADISGLPKNFNEGVDPQGCCGKSVTMPACDDDETVNYSCNCQAANIDATSSAAPLELRGPLAGSIPTKHPSSSNSFIVIVVIFVAIFILALCFFMYLAITWLKRKKAETRIQRLKILVAISVKDVDRNSWQSMAADRMCCFMQEHGEVTYTLWHTTELCQTNSVRWMYDEMKKAQHVILVITPHAIEDDVESAETDALLNRAYDPYYIVKRQMEGDGCNFSIIYFDHHLVLPSSLQHIKSRYYLPDDAHALCRHLFACDVNVEKLLQGNLKKPSEWVTSEPILIGRNVGDIPEVTVHDPSSNISEADDQADSGYHTFANH